MGSLVECRPAVEIGMSTEEKIPLWLICLAYHMGLASRSPGPNPFLETL